MHKYAYMAWDRNFGYFLRQLKKKRIISPPTIAGRRNASKEGAGSSMQQSSDRRNLVDVDDN